MELFGIALSVPVALVASMLYCFFLDRVVMKFERPRRLLLFASYFVLAFFAAELVMLFTLGAVHSSAILGPSFYAVHVALFFLCVPTLANLLLLRQRRFVDNWYVAAALCTVFAFFLVLLQYSVSESLDGIE